MDSELVVDELTEGKEAVVVMNFTVSVVKGLVLLN